MVTEGSTQTVMDLEELTEEEEEEEEEKEERDMTTAKALTYK